MTRRVHWTAGLLLLSTLVGGAPACAASGARLYVRVGPPAPIVERLPVAPGPRYVWVPGYYRWDGRAYLWAPGAYLLPPAHRTRWVPGHWARDRRGYFWIDGHWR